MAELSRRQFLTGAALATAGGALTLGGCAPKGSAAKAPSDEASVATVGSGMGKHGSIQVEVITKNGAIERIDVLDSRESAGLGDVCMDKLGKLIVEGQTLNVDVVSGASLSSMAYLTAVAEALDKAGEKSSEWKKRDKALQRPDNDIPTSYDVVIVGAGDEYAFDCKAVVLSCGGFGANVEMRAKANPEFGEQFNSTDSVGAQGDGLTMASAIGADLVDMELIQTYPICDVDTGALLYLDDMRLDERTVMFNKEGKRFVEELGRRDVLSKAILEQTDERAYEIWDQAAADETKVVDIHSDEFENLASRKLCVKADTLEEACEPFGIDAAQLSKTIEQWNGYVDAGSDPDFAYRGTMHKVDTPPYYIMAYKPAVHYTMGGLRINTSAEVLDVQGSPIPGLYAAGEVAGHKMGTNRLGSTSMADIYTFGRIAGDNAADYVA